MPCSVEDRSRQHPQVSSAGLLSDSDVASCAWYIHRALLRCRHGVLRASRPVFSVWRHKLLEREDGQSGQWDNDDCTQDPDAWRECKTYDYHSEEDCEEVCIHMRV